MIALGLTSAVFILVLAGFGVTMLLLRRPARLHVIECICLSWLFGTGTVSLVLWIAGALMRGFSLSATVAIVSLTLGICGWIRARSQNVTWSVRRPAGAAEWLLVVVLIIEIGFAIFASWKSPLGWDGSFNWENKARIAFLSGGAIPSGYYSSDSQTLGHPEYPLLIPFTELWLYLCIGEPHQFWVKMIFPVFYVVGIGLLASIATRLCHRSWAGLAAAALLFFIPAFVRHSGGVASGYVDLPLSVMYLAAVGYLVLFLDRGDPNLFRLSAGALTMLPWIKVEGSILWLAGGLCALTICWRRKKIRMGIAGVLPGAALIGAWQLFLHSVSARPPHDFMKMDPAALWANVDRIPAIALSVLKEFGRVNNWSFFWLLVALALAYGFVRARDERLLVLTVTLVLPVVLYSLAYIFSTWPDFRAHMLYSLVRLLLHVTPVGALLIALALPFPRTNDRVA